MCQPQTEMLVARTAYRTKLLPVVSSAQSRCVNSQSLARATLLVVVAGLIWRTVRYALAFPLWGDEAYVAINLLTRDLSGLARPLDYFQVAPPGFLWVEWLVVHGLGNGERALRLVPYLAGIVSLVLFWRFCRGVATRRTVLLAVGMLATSFYPVRHATEVKPYAIDLLVALVLQWAAWAVVRDLRSYRWWFVLGATAVVGVWCSYAAIIPAVGVALFVGAAVASERSVRLIVLWGSLVLSMLLSWGIMFGMVARPQARPAAFPALAPWNDAFPPLAAPWQLPWWLLDVHTGNMLAYPYGGNHFGSTLTTILVVVGCIRIAQRRVRRPLLFLLLSPLPVAFVAAAVHAYPYGTSTRVMLYMAPAFCLLTGEGIMAALQLRRWASHGPLVAGGVFATVALVCMVFNVVSPYKAYDDVLHRRVARWVAARTKPGDEWIVFNGASPLPILKNLMVMPWIQRVGEAHYYLLTCSPVPVRWQPDPETIVPNGGGKVWLVVQNHGDAGYFPKESLANYERELRQRLGPPRATTRFELPRGETWSIAEFGPERNDVQSPVTTVTADYVWPARGDTFASSSASR
jgi:hypothetical protein